MSSNDLIVVKPGEKGEENMHISLLAWLTNNHFHEKNNIICETYACVESKVGVPKKPFETAFKVLFRAKYNKKTE